MRYVSTLLFAFFFFSCSSFLSKGPDAWGNVTSDIHSMEHSHLDSSSSAIVLFDKARYEFDLSEWSVNIYRHKRIKIFKESGKEYANIKIPFWNEDKISGIKAQAILQDGTIIKLGKRDVHKEGNPKKWMYKVFTIPGVTDNCVIEFSYTHTSSYITYLDPWYFQSSIPTVQTSISVDIPIGLVYNCYLTNSPVNDYKPSQEKRINPNGRNSIEYSWSFIDLPPIKDEPFMTTPRDYMCKLNFQLLEVKNNYVWHRFVKTWEDIHENVIDDYKSYIKSSPRLLENIADDILEGKRKRLDKIQALYTYVRDSIETTEYNGLFGDRIESSKYTLKMKSGSRIDKNLLLVNLLNISNIQCYPMLISTRAHGIPDLSNPRLDVFNHVIAYIPSRKGDIVLDTKSKYYPADYLPSSDIGRKGLVITEDEAKVINIPESNVLNKIQIVNAASSINENGDLIIESDIELIGYRNSFYRSQIDNSESIEEFVEENILDNLNDIKISKVTSNNDSSTVEDNLTIHIEFTIPHFCETVGDEIYVPVSLISKYTKNVFSLENRTYPVDYNYTRQDSEQSYINIPDGYSLLELPDNLEFKARGHYFTRTIFQRGKKISVARNLNIHQVYFLPIEYETLKEFYSLIVQADRDIFVLKQD